jgi:hypothetical protein
VLQGKKPLFIVLSQRKVPIFCSKKSWVPISRLSTTQGSKTVPDGWMDALPNLASHCATATTTGTMEPKGGEHHVTH